MKRSTWIIFLLILISILYLNRAYAHIYNKIGEEFLKSSDNLKTYSFGQSSQKELKYVAVGDSLTAGVGTDSYQESFPYQLAQKFSENGKNVILETVAIPGAKTGDIINRLDEIIAKKPDVITLLIGINDIHSQITSKDFQDNYEIILKKLTENTKAKIYLINLPYLGRSDLMLPPYNFIYNSKTNEFNKIIKQLAATYGLYYIDLYAETTPKQIGSISYYASDSFHPSAIGYFLWSKIIYDDINK